VEIYPTSSGSKEELYFREMFSLRRRKKKHDERRGGIAGRLQKWEGVEK
jgi:hypothetical protein